MKASKTVVVVDYGMGNLRSVSQALNAVAHTSGHLVQISDDPLVIQRADRVVLPGQGAMRDCMASLYAARLAPAVLQAAQTKPLFGVCVGMQMLLDHSEEGNIEGTSGLGIIPGEVKKFNLSGVNQSDGSRFKVPQMGWNQVYPTSHDGRIHPLWEGIAAGSYFYFVHSYFARPRAFKDVSAETDYGQSFASALANGYVFATQFHPEKSSQLGLRLYRNFLQWNP